MKTVTARRLVALLGYVSCLAAGAPALAQIGPIQPVLVTEGRTEMTQVRPDFDDYSVPLDVFVAPDGSVTNAVVSESTGNVKADSVAAAYMRDRRFLPGLDAHGQPVAAVVKVAVNMYKRGTRKVVRVTVKPPPIVAETRRVRQLMCADFLWEVERMEDQAGIHDPSLEVMPYVAARMYMTEKALPDSVADKFWDLWPDQLEKIVDRCEKDQTKMFFTEVLVPALDGALPSRDTATAAAQ